MIADHVVKFMHYGSHHFNPERFTPVRNGYKPEGGFWASPYIEIDDNTEWENWCKRENFGQARYSDCPRFKFILSYGTNLLVIDNKNYKKVPRVNNSAQFWKVNYIDVEALSNEYDAIFVDLWNIPDCNILFPMWDVPSLIVFNPAVIKEVD